MKKFVLIPDSFKGTMSSKEICDVMQKAILRSYPSAQVVAIPVADGGEGSVDCFLSALGGRRVPKQVAGPHFEEMEAFYGLLPEGHTAVVEMAACAGLPLAGDNPNPALTTTFGVGQLILDAAQRGAKKIIVGLGGSATNDGGCGAAAAAGVRFYDAQGKDFVPVGGTLHRISRIDLSGRNPALEGVEVVAMCDIDNPMHGPTGAAAVFAPQKGANPDMVTQLDTGLRRLDTVMQQDLGKNLADVPGAGAAGAMGAGMMAFFGAGLQMGIETVLDTVEFEQAARNADIIFTGEGRIDGQSLRGKVVVGVARRAAALKVPVVAVVGDIAEGAEDAWKEGVSAIFSINRLAVPYTEARHTAKKDLALTMDNLLRFCVQMGL